MALLTDQILATAVTKNNLIHIVDTDDTSQNPAGSSFKASLVQVAEAISGLLTPDLKTVLQVGNLSGDNDIIFPTKYGIYGDLGYGVLFPQDDTYSGFYAGYNGPTGKIGYFLMNDTFLKIGFDNSVDASSIDCVGDKIAMGNGGGTYEAVSTGPSSGLTISPIGNLYIENLNSGNTVAYLGLTSDNIVVTGQTPKTYGLFSQTDNSATVSGTTSETSILGFGVGTLTVPANGFSVGDSFTAIMSGHLGSNNTSTLTIRIKTGSITLGTIGPINMANATNQHFKLNLNFTIRSIGGAGFATIMTEGDFSYSKNASTAFEQSIFTNQNNSTFDTTSSNTLDITAQWNSTNSANSIYSEIFTLNKVY